MAKQFATRLSLLAFSAMLLDGIVCGTDFHNAMFGAFASAIVFLFVGLACGEMAKRIVQEMAAREAQQLVKQKVTPFTDR